MMTKDGQLSGEETPMTTAPEASVLMSIPIVSAMEGIVVGEDGVSMVDCSIKSEVDETLEGIAGTREEEEVEADITQMLTADGNLVEPSNQTALQSLLSTSPAGSQVINQQDGIQVIALPSNEGLVNLHPEISTVQILPSKYFGVFAIANPTTVPGAKVELTGLPSLEMMPDMETAELTSGNMAAILMSQQSQSSGFPPGCPPWAARLKKCEKIGDSYRGYVENEVNLDLVLTLHKQQTNSFWGTRQSPSTAKTSTRLMWKSQYVPFDGIPFINAGSRAVVMECQFGPRRKGTVGKRGSSPSDLSSEFRKTCPARIYIKKVHKFPDYAVNLNTDRKSIRLAMDKAFHELREKGSVVWGEDRYYVQLPTEKAHDYHEGTSVQKVEQVSVGPEAPEEAVEVGASQEARIHPAVLEKIRQLVAGGETKLYAIRKQLRKFVVRDLFHGSGHVPERHDLTVFPTVNDLKNHIHQAMTDIQNGSLVLDSSQVSLTSVERKDDASENVSVKTEKVDLTSMWCGTVNDLKNHITMAEIQNGSIVLTTPQAPLAVSDERKDDGCETKAEKSELSSSIWSGAAMPETVTVTLTQSPGEDGHHIISRIETHLSDGTTQVSTTLTPETAQLLSRLHPTLFRTENIVQNEDAPSDSVESQLVPPTDDQSVEPPEGSSSEHPMSGIDTSHVIDGLDPSHLSSMVDFDPHSHISAMIDSDPATTISSLVNADPSHAISDIQMDASSTQNISGIVDAECSSLGSIVTSDPHHLSALSRGHISVLGGIDPATISKIVSSGTTHLSIITPNGHPVDTIALTTTGGNGHISVSRNSVSLQGVDNSTDSHFISEDSCVPVITKSTHLGSEEDGSKLEDDKINLHMTSDQDMGVTRLENQVSVL